MSSSRADDDEPMWLQLSGALVPGRDGSPASSGKSPQPPGAAAAGRRSHSAEWRAQFEARSRLAEAATPEPPASAKAAGKARAVSEEEPDWLQSAGAILEPATPSTQQGYITPAPQMPSGVPSAAPPPRQHELTVADLEPDSFLAQLIQAAGPAPAGQAQPTQTTIL